MYARQVYVWGCATPPAQQITWVSQLRQACMETEGEGSQSLEFTVYPRLASDL
jgi:hypothetical protein